MNMALQEPIRVITIGMDHADGFTAVPEARFIRYMPAGFMSIMFMFMPAWGSSCAAAIPASATSAKIFRDITKFSWGLYSRTCFNDVGRTSDAKNDRGKNCDGARRGSGGSTPVLSMAASGENGMAALWITAPSGSGDSK